MRKTAKPVRLASSPILRTRMMQVMLCWWMRTYLTLSPWSVMGVTTAALERDHVTRVRETVTEILIATVLMMESV